MPYTILYTGILSNYIHYFMLQVGEDQSKSELCIKIVKVIIFKFVQFLLILT